MQHLNITVHMKPIYFVVILGPMNRIISDYQIFVAQNMNFTAVLKCRPSDCVMRSVDTCLNLRRGGSLGSRSQESTTFILLMIMFLVFTICGCQDKIDNSSNSI